MLKEEQTILALDTATHCGYAVYKNGKVITAGVWNLDRKDNGVINRYGTLYDRIQATIERYKITHIVKEDVYLDTTSHKKDNAFKVLCELAGVVKLVAFDYNVTITNIETRQMQRFMFGRLAQRFDAKQAMCNKITQLGYTLFGTHKDDMADALGLLFTYIGKTIQLNNSRI